VGKLNSNVAELVTAARPRELHRIGVTLHPNFKMSTTQDPPSNPPADTPSPKLHALIRTRWSPRQFLDRPIAPGDLQTLFEAARWAPSCFNEQPWRFVVATRDQPEHFAKVLGLLMEMNQKWAQTAWLLGFSAGKKTFTHNSAPDRFGLYDAGAASANLAIEATALGLHIHFMGGFDSNRARTEFGVPEDFEIGAAFAAGYIDQSSTQPGARVRKPLRDIVFGNTWGQTATFIEK
jgi:nitroreductase